MMDVLQKLQSLKDFSDIEKALLQITAQTYCVEIYDLNADQSENVHQKNPNKLIMPGSIYKLITLYLLFESGVNLKHKIVIQQEDVTKGSGNNLQVGDVISIKQLAKNMFFSSSNSSAVVIRKQIEDHLNKSYFDFYAERFENLSLQHTQVRNEHGLFNKEQATTVYEFLQITKWVLKNRKLLKFLQEYSQKCKVKILRNEKKITIYQHSNENSYFLKTGSLFPNVFNTVLILPIQNIFLIACLGYSKSTLTRTQDIQQIIKLL
ncbi:serine hydrolase [Acinetobacter sp. ANC 5579]|uniref:serine hydrolase n=2 Tax=Moraxellaceae TaxID=468 RepID=UPI0020BD5CE6|nr:serine hydrolase [Acinetobacter amyesii]MCL6232998.1 serine hydrolase [Acinetobacter amyesii]MCL6233730.1 serine hydrolase [Acinetobacter amyesii]